MERKLFCFWTGDNEIPVVRARSIDSLPNSGLEVYLITNDTVGEYLSEGDLHPAYYSLNLAHRADYLRAYFMHHYGGGYCDIKKVNQSWLPIFEQLMTDENLLAAGYREDSRHGIANIFHSAQLLEFSLPYRLKEYARWRWLQLHYTRVVGNGAFIFKPKTEIIYRWWNEVNRRLDQFSNELAKHPANHHKERTGVVYDGKVSNYPIPWSYLLGDILHPLILKYSSRVLRSLPAPDRTNYQ
jgi:hypothetical protein